MMLKGKSLGIPVAALLVAGVIAAHPAPAQACAGPPAAEPGAQTETVRKIVLVRLVEGNETAREKRPPDELPDSEADRDEPGDVTVIDGEKIARDVEEAVGAAVSEAMDALEEMELSIRDELDGKKLEALSEEYRHRLGEMREQLEDIGDRLAKDAAELEGHVTRAGEKAVKAAREAGEALRETRVIVIRNGKDAKVEIEKDEQGRTVVIIDGEDVEVIAPEKPGEEENSDLPPE